MKMLLMAVVLIGGFVRCVTLGFVVKLLWS